MIICPEQALEACPPSIRLRMRPHSPCILAYRTGQQLYLPCFSGVLSTGIFLEKMPGAACQFRPRRNQPIPAGASVFLPRSPNPIRLFGGSSDEPQPLNLHRMEAVLSQTLTNRDIRQIQKTRGMV